MVEWGEMLLLHCYTMSNRKPVCLLIRTMAGTSAIQYTARSNGSRHFIIYNKISVVGFFVCLFMQIPHCFCRRLYERNNTLQIFSMTTFLILLVDVCDGCCLRSATWRMTHSYYSPLQCSRVGSNNGRGNTLKHFIRTQYILPQHEMFIDSGDSDVRNDHRFMTSLSAGCTRNAIVAFKSINNYTHNETKELKRARTKPQKN